MNKEVIYLEPEDDITDILSKLQQAKEKLVALVPPKKTTMLRSAVNMKLVARTAKECDKVAVIVTADPAVVKMAMTAQIPIAKSLNSRPVVPTKEDVDRSMAEEQVIDEDLADASAADELDTFGIRNNAKNAAKTPVGASNSASGAPAKKGADVLNLDEETLENGSKAPKKGKSADKNPKNAENAPFFVKYRKWVLVGASALAVFILFGIWAFVFAPSAKITIAMKTSSENFSEEIHFTTDQSAENLDEAKILVAKQTLEQKYESDFAATGKEDRGERAKGNLKLSLTFTPADKKDGISINIPSGTEFVASNGKVYKATAGGDITWDGSLPVSCTNGTVSRVSSSCTLAVTVPVEASGSGEDFNLDKGGSWNNFQGASVSNPDAISGGTTKNVTIVSPQNLQDIRDKLVKEHADENKAKLLEQFKKDDKSSVIIIEPSYSEDVVEAVSKPAVGSEVSGGKATASVKVSYSVYTIPKDQAEKMIGKKLSIGTDQRIYSIGDPYFDRFTTIDESARMKTTVKIGPTVTESDIVDRTKGKKIGEVQSLLRSMNGVSSVDVSRSYFWVNSVPNDPAKITVDLTVEDKE